MMNFEGDDWLRDVCMDGSEREREREGDTQPSRIERERSQRMASREKPPQTNNTSTPQIQDPLFFSLSLPFIQEGEVRA